MKGEGGAGLVWFKVAGGKLDSPVAKFFPEDLQKKLFNQRIATEILHFDIRRNIFEPNYQPCLALPCHQQLSREQLEIMVKFINHL